MSASERFVELLVTDMFGHQLAADVSIDEIDRLSGKVLASWSKGATSRSLPEGKHRLRVHVPGFNYEYLEIAVSDSAVFRPVGMKVGSLTGGDNRVPVKGRLIGHRSGPRIRVRASSVFSREIEDTTVAPKGSFTFGDLEPGRYLVEVIAEDRVVCIAQRDVVGYEMVLNLDLRSCKAPN